MMNIYCQLFIWGCNGFDGGVEARIAGGGADSLNGTLLEIKDNDYTLPVAA